MVLTNMLDLHFEVFEAEPLPYAAAPQLIFKTEITNARAGETIHTIALQCQIMIESVRRRYTAEEKAHLRDLFDEPERWSETLRTMLWTHASVTVPSFTGKTIVNLPVECSLDFNLAATKYFEGLETGEVPLLLQFSGTCFYAGANGLLQVAQISWTKETQYRLPVRVWREMMEIYYPNSVFLQLRRDTFDRLYQYKVRHAIPTFEQTLERLLPITEETEKEFSDLEDEIK